MCVTLAFTLRVWATDLDRVGVAVWVLELVVEPVLVTVPVEVLELLGDPVIVGEVVVDFDGRAVLEGKEVSVSAAVLEGVLVLFAVAVIVGVNVKVIVVVVFDFPVTVTVRL